MRIKIKKTYYFILILLLFMNLTSCIDTDEYFKIDKQLSTIISDIGKSIANEGNDGEATFEAIKRLQNSENNERLVKMKELIDKIDKDEKKAYELWNRIYNDIYTMKNSFDKWPTLSNEEKQVLSDIYNGLTSYRMDEKW